MAIAIAAQFPDIFTALHVEAGDPYGEDPVEDAGREVYEVMGANAHRFPMMISYGTLDPFALGGAAEDALKHWLIANDWIDDGMANGSVSLTPASTREGKDGKEYSVDTYVDANGCVLAERWLIKGLFHAYSGGDPTAIWDIIADPNAPNMREIAYDFFLDQWDPAGPPGCRAASGGGTSGGGGGGGGSVDPLGLAVLFLLAAWRGVARRRS